MTSDLEARLRRAEQQLAAVSLQLRRVAPQRATALQQAITSGGLGLGATYTGGDGNIVYHDSGCNVDLPAQLIAELVWGLSDEFSGSITLDWEEDSETWSGCGVLHWPGAILASPQATGGGLLAYRDDLAVDSPVVVTFDPAAVSPGPDWGPQVVTLGLLMGDRNVADGVALRMPAAGQCGTPPNYTPLVAQGDPCARSAFIAFPVGFVQQGGINYSASWNLDVTVRIPDAA